MIEDLYSCSELKVKRNSKIVNKQKTIENNYLQTETVIKALKYLQERQNNVKDGSLTINYRA